MKILYLKKVILLTLCFFVAASVQAAPTSETYKIEYDSINFVGGRSTSETYSLKGTGGEAATGRLSSETYIIEAGLQAMDSSSLVVGFTGDPNLSPGIILPQGGRSDGVVSWVVTSSSGYTLTVKNNYVNFMGHDGLATSQGNTIPDYVPSSKVVSSEPFYSIIDEGPLDYDWILPATQSAFGFSATGTDVHLSYKNNGTACGIGNSISAFHCWDSFRPIPPGGSCNGDCGDYVHDNELTERTVATRNTASSFSTTTLDLRVEVGANANQPQGVYRMTLSATVNAH